MTEPKRTDVPDHGGRLPTRAPLPLSEPEKHYYKLLRRMSDPKVVGKRDGMFVCKVAKLLAKEASGGLGVGEQKMLLDGLAHLGMSPHGRKRLGAATGEEVPKDHNKFADFG